jgi:uncharacterized repeat protein (TIGR03803 family)
MASILSSSRGEAKRALRFAIHGILGWALFAAHVKTGIAQEPPGLRLVVFSSISPRDVNANGVILGRDGDLYGTTQNGGSSGDGSVFKVTRSGTLTRFCNFRFVKNGEPSELPDGIYPNPLIQASDGYLYGTTQLGGRLSR